MPSLREEMWPLSSDLGEKKKVGKIQTTVITCQHLQSSHHVPGLMLSTMPTSYLSPRDEVCVWYGVSLFTDGEIKSQKGEVTCSVSPNF